MEYSEGAVRDNLRNREGRRVFYLGREDSLSREAENYLIREGIQILPAEEARPQRYRLENGGYLEEKPEEMTHLNGEVLVPKTHPRILFRGEMDALEAQIMLCQLKLQGARKELGELLTLCREILRCDVLDSPLPEATLCGLTSDEIRRRSHRPQDFYGQPHFMPQWTDGEEILELNRLRTQVRRTELAAVRAFGGKRGDLIQALNRMSSMVYLLMIRRKKAGR